ncbi:MarR family transcriptional regulator [Halobaculum sp. MBLA0147]|uniref:MarR family transcriptional regulator n=1 Tax=Halobaculum sp. MBLA0147 TaxID=3079934 RepID=UPI003525FD47
MPVQPRWEEFRRFFNQKGAVPIILILDNREGMIFKQLADELPLSQTTVSDRIKTARDLQLVEPTAKPGDHGNARRYVLTEVGLYLKEILRDMGVEMAYKEYIRHKRMYEEGIEVFTEWGEEHFDGETELMRYLAIDENSELDHPDAPKKTNDRSSWK